MVALTFSVSTNINVYFLLVIITLVILIALAALVLCRASYLFHRILVDGDTTVDTAAHREVAKTKVLRVSALAGALTLHV